MVQANRKSRKDTDVITLKLTRRQLRMIRNAFIAVDSEWLSTWKMSKGLMWSTLNAVMEALGVWPCTRCGKDIKRIRFLCKDCRDTMNKHGH